MSQYSATKDVPRVAWLCALVVVVIIFATNSDWGGDRTSPRGDGTYRPVLARGDGHMLYLMTHSLVFDGDLVFDNQLERFGDPWNQPTTPTGRKMIPHPIGPALVNAPLLAGAHGLSKVAGAVGAAVPEHGYTMFHQRLVFALSPLFAVGAALLGARASRRLGVGRWAALYAGIAVLFGTSLTYYATYMPSYAHAMDAFSVAALVAYWLRTRGSDDWLRMVAFGALLGLAALIRVTNFAWGALLAVELVARAVRDRPRAGRILVGGQLALAVAFVVFTPQLLAWKLVFGEWFVSPMGPAFVRLQHSQWLEVLFSSRNGWLSSHPVAFLGALGLLFAPRGERATALSLLLAVAVLVWVNGAAGDWWAGASLGNRRLNSATVVLVIGLGWLLARVARWTDRLPTGVRHGAALALLTWFVAWNLVEVSALRRGRAANSRPRGCCAQGGIPGRLVQPLYDAAGNPFAWPASLAFARRYDVHPRRWDAAVGTYADRPDLSRHNDGTYREIADTWPLSAAHFGPWLLDGWGDRQMYGPGRVEPIAYRVARDGAVFLLPLWMPDARIFEVGVVPELLPDGARPRLELWIDGARVGDARVNLAAGVAEIPVAREHLGVGMHRVELRWSAAPAEGVPVRDLRLRYP